MTLPLDTGWVDHTLRLYRLKTWPADWGEAPELAHVVVQAQRGLAPAVEAWVGVRIPRKGDHPVEVRFPLDQWHTLLRWWLTVTPIEEDRPHAAPDV
jgi:hypothetical protein